MGVSPLDLARRAIFVPWTRIPDGRIVHLPGRGSTYVHRHPGAGRRPAFLEAVTTVHARRDDLRQV